MDQGERRQISDSTRLERAHRFRATVSIIPVIIYAETGFVLDNHLVSSILFLLYKLSFFMSQVTFKTVLGGVVYGIGRFSYCSETFYSIRPVSSDTESQVGNHSTAICPRRGPVFFIIC